MDIIVHGVQSARLFLTGFGFNKQTGNYYADVRFELYDDFGLSRDDVTKFNPYTTPCKWGLDAWWILQHQRKYKPFVTKISIISTFKGKIPQYSSMTYNIYFLLLFFLPGCMSTDKLEIQPLHPYTKIEEKNDGKTKYIYFYVKNFDLEKKNYYDSLAHFASRYRFSDVDTSKFSMYSVEFFSHSDKTNEKYRESPSDLVLWHGKDLLFTIFWGKNNDPITQRYVKGEVIDSSDVQMGPIKADTTNIN